MAIHVYISKECAKDIERQKYSEQIEAFKSKIEKAQHTDVFDRFPPPFLKKRFERQVRLIARECLVGDDIVIAFLRLLVRGGGDYASFGDSGYRILPGFDRIAPELEPEALMRFVESRQEPPPPPPPEPTQHESHYLHSALSGTHNIYDDFHCCETKLWVDRIQSDEFSSRLSLFVEPILETMSSREAGLAEAKCKDGRFGFLFRLVPEEKTIILFTPFNGKAPRDEVQESYADLLRDGPLDKDATLRRSKRAYPLELVLNEDSWFRVQKDKEGNMALSLEEIAVLESARVSDGGYPLFINGRAGSGKSTILQYLFAEYLGHHLESDRQTSGPVLFACNDELLARSSTSVRSILQARHGRGEAKARTFEEWFRPLETEFREAFRNFHSWLRELADSEAFPAAKLIDYGNFKQWWESRFGKEPSARKLFGADISWHVIRTYIKGISAEDYLEPDDYLEIPAKQKSVTPETYRIIYDKVWRRYREDQKEKGLWDHQDLARHVLDKGLVEPAHPVVFCDEAQDFTRIELEILHRHCLFNSRTLNPMDLGRVPLAFAGDPFQTLNPTGFRWEATKAFFTEKFIRSFPGLSRDLNYHELTYNYRSSRHIVHFCNSLQLVRSVVFGFSEIKPQHAWEDDEEAPSVFYYERGDVEVLKTLKNQSEIRIIVPCEEGGEAQWARENGLEDYVEFDEADVPKNVVSPTRVKGLEFTRVVLFGFGGACPPALRKAISASANSAVLEGDQAIEPQYFLNRLYVAASRPRKRLFIIDSVADIESFWNQIFVSQETSILRTENVEQWESMCGQILKGSPETWESDKEDPLEIATKLEREGRLRRDRVLLRQAALSYDTAKKPILAKKCRSEALELEGRFLDAAKSYQEMQEYDLSLAAAWKHGAGGYNFIIQLAESRPDLKNRIHYKVADFFASNRGMNDGVALLKDLAEALEEESLRKELLLNANWHTAVEACLAAILKENATETGLWRVAYGSVDALKKAGVRVSPQAAGEIAFRGDLPKEAYRQWENVKPEARAPFERNFLRAKASALSFPQNLDVYAELLPSHRNRKDADDFLNIVQSEGSDGLKPLHREMLVLSYLIMGDRDRAFSSLGDVTSAQLLAEALESAAKADESHHIQAGLKRLAATLADLAQWDALLGLFKRGALSDLSMSATATWAASHRNVFARPLLEVLASSSEIESARHETKTSFAELIRKKFGQDFSWRQEVHPLLVGRALERIGLFKETLPYFELVAASNLLSEQTRKLAWQRWARTKWLQSLRDREQKATGKADKSYREAIEVAERSGYRSPDTIPEELPSPLPPVDPDALQTKRDASQTRLDVPEDTKSAQEVAGADTGFARKHQIGDFEIRVGQDGTRVNLVNLATLEQASVNVVQESVSFEGTALQVDASALATIPNWDLALDLSKIAAGEVSLRLPDGLGLKLPVATGNGNKG